MAVPQELIDKINGYEANYTPDEILQGIEASNKYPDVIAKIKSYREQEYSAADIITGIKSSAPKPLSKWAKVGAFLSQYGPPELQMTDERPVREAKGALVTGLVAAPIAGLGAVISPVVKAMTVPPPEALTQQDIEPVPSEGKPFEEISQGLTYQPKTKEGTIIASEAGEAISKPFTMAGEGWRQIGEQIEKAPAAPPEAGLPLEEQTGLKYVEPTLATIGETAAVFGFPGSIRTSLERLQSSLWYRKMSVPERSLVTKSFEDMLNEGMTGEQIRKAWADPANREALLKKYAGKQTEEEIGGTDIVEPPPPSPPPKPQPKPRAPQGPPPVTPSAPIPEPPIKTLVREVLNEKAIGTMPNLPPISTTPTAAEGVTPVPVSTSVQAPTPIVEAPKEETPKPAPAEGNVFSRMPEEALRKQAEYGVAGAKVELARRTAERAKPIIEMKAEETEAAKEPDLQSYAQTVGKDEKIKGIHLVGSSVTGKGKDIDIVYDYGKVNLPNGDAAIDKITDLLESTEGLNLDLYDTFIKADDRYFHVSSGAGRDVVENTEYGKEQEGKPSKALYRESEAKGNAYQQEIMKKVSENPDSLTLPELEIISNFAPEEHPYRNLTLDKKWNSFLQFLYDNGIKGKDFNTYTVSDAKKLLAEKKMAGKLLPGPLETTPTPDTHIYKEGEKAAPPRPEYLKDVAQNAIDSIRKAVTDKDAETLKKWLHTGNKNLRKYFTDLTGVKLPKTQGGTKTAIDEWAKKQPAYYPQVEEKKLLGKNSEGQDVFEDKNGVRYIVEKGIRITEPVSMVPTKGGVVAQPATPRSAEYEVVEGKPAQPEKLTPLDTPEIIEARKKAAEIPKTINIDTPERISYRDTLATEEYGNGAAKKERRADIVLGGPASGKSTQLVEPLAKEHGSLIIDNDQIKKKLPEYNNGIGAAAVHEEASLIADVLILKKALRAGDNIVWVRLGKTLSTMQDAINDLKKEGYSVHIHYMDLPPLETAKRAVTRFQETGRFIDPNFILNTVDTKPKDVYNKLKEDEGVDSYEAYSNDVPKGEVPRLLETGIRETAVTARGERRGGSHGGEGIQGAEGGEREGTPGRKEVKGGEKGEYPRDGSTGKGALEENKPPDLQENGEKRRPSKTERSGSKIDRTGNEDADVREDERAGSLASEPGVVHIPDGGSDGGELQTVEESPQSTPASEPRTVKLAGDNPGNYRITEQDDLGGGTRGQKIDRNMAAIRLVKTLEQEKRYPTKDEQATLAKYVGWGGLKSVFDKASKKPQDIRAREELEQILTKDEYLGMFLSITDAHYTSREIITSMYDIVRHMGFKGGNVLEPTYGAGNFLGLMPEDMSASSKWYGSELDPITAKIGQYLYPESQLIESGFQEAEFPFGKFDLAIGNPPFGDTRIADTKKSRAEINRFKIHNYVIAKEGMHLRPGGILANVVTTRFLDTADPEARDFLAKHFRFLGAVRLPNDAFEKTAGTQVTTDIIFLQRLMPDEKPDLKADWLTTGATMTNAAGETVTLNKYFADRPHMMLGEPSMKGTMYGGAWKEGGKGEFTLDKREGQNTGELIKGVIDTHFADLKGIFQQRKNDKADAAAISLNINKEDVGIGGFYAEGNKIYRRGDNDEYDNPTFELLTPEMKWTEKTPLGQKRYDRIKGMLNLRAKAYKLIEAERFDLDNIEDLRKDLNKAYDKFVKEHGYLSEPGNFKLMSDDIKIEFGLESAYKKEITPTRAKALGIKPSPAVATKASILTKRVFYPAKEILFAKDVTDGYGISLSEKGALDIEYIAKLTGKTADEVATELSDLNLIYKDPEIEKWIQEDDYLSGNVKGKHKIAVEKGFEKNAEALKKVFPPDKTAENIYAGIGATWIPKEVYAAFAEFIGIDRPRVLISEDTGKVYINGNTKQNDVNVHFQNEDYDIASLFNAAAGHKTLIAYDGSGDDRTVNKERTKGLATLVKNMKNTFDDWLMAEDTRAALIVKTYNETQNTHAERQFNGEHLRTVGASPAVVLRNTQRNGAWRMVQSPVVLLDHAVGAGKTFTIITGIMEKVRMGLTKKAIIVVPNHLVGQWAADWLKLYPGANILAATNKDFSKPNRRRLFSRIATGNFDAVICGHSSFGFIPIERETIRELVHEEIAHLERAEADAIAAGEKRMAKNLAKRIQKKRERIRELMSKPRDNVSHFEQMGIDHIVVDESHEFKNLEYSSSMQNITGMGNPAGSKRAFDLYSKIRWLTRQTGYGITFATGTPISNSLVEMYAILRYLNRKGLVDRKIEAFDAWASAYAQTENRIEYTASQRLKDRVIMATFRNIHELVQLYKEFSDSITMEDLKRIYAEQIRESNRLTGAKEREEFPIPNVEQGGRQLNLGEPDDGQRKFVDYLVARAQRLEDLGRDNDPKVDNHLWLMSDARKMALDIRLVDPTAKPGKDNKVQRSAREIWRIYKKWNADKGTQLVFCDLSTPAKTAQKEAHEFINKSLKIAKIDKDADVQKTLQEMDSFQEQWKYIRYRIEREIEAISESREAETTAFMQRRETLEHFLNEVATDSVVASLTTADTGFSVYDDLKSTLIKKGIPAGEIRFIHDANSPERKIELFGLVNSGAVRVLIGSTQKMGAGTNAQERMVALHHLDAPWRPSDVEQREGRLVRQGNALYDRDPDKFLVEIHAYSTSNTFDAVMWQILARKQDMLNDFRSGKDTIEEGASDSASYADFMAETTGNPAFREKFKLEGEIEELTANQRRIRTRRQSAEHTLKYNEGKRGREKEELQRQEKVYEELKSAENDNFVYEGKEYINDIGKAEEIERERLREVNQAAEEAHKPIKEKVDKDVIKNFPRVFNKDGTIKDGIKFDSAEYKEAKEYYEKKLEEAGIEKWAKQENFDREKIAKKDPKGATAAAVKMRRTINDFPQKQGGTLKFTIGGQEVKIIVSDNGNTLKDGSSAEESDYKFFVNNAFVGALWDKKVLSWDAFAQFLNISTIRNYVASNIRSAESNIRNMDAEDVRARQTLEKLQFKDEEKLRAKQERYRDVVREVNELEEELEAKRESEENKYIEQDTERFGDNYDPAAARRQRKAQEEARRRQQELEAIEGKQPKPFKPDKKALDALKKQVAEEWDESEQSDEYVNFIVNKAKAAATLAKYGEYNIDQAETIAKEAKRSLEEDWDWEEGEEEEVKQTLSDAWKIIRDIEQGQQTFLYSGIDITKLPAVLKSLWSKFRLSELVEAYKRPPEVTELKLIIGKYTGALQQIDQKLVEWAWKINKEVPKDRQIAITNYLQAGGDVSILQHRAANSAKSYRKGYEDAMNLTPEDVAWADAIRQRYDEIWDIANKAGIIEDYVDNYVRGEWEKPNNAGRKFVSQANAGALPTNPSEARKKIFENYFEGEQAGYTPKDKRIGYQLIAAERSIRMAIEARKALKAMLKSTEKDGRPTIVVSGVGGFVKDEQGNQGDTFLIKPNVKKQGASDYRFIDHPALRKWKWIAGSEKDGNLMLVQGNMWIHPAAFGRINALLGKSRIKEYTIPERIPVIGGRQPGRGALQTGAFIKGTILLGPFHQFHVGEHAIFHKVSPFNLPEIDFDKRPLLLEGVEHGLMLFNHNALYEFGEGLATGGLFHRIPIAGDYLLKYQEWLFQEYIPKLKAMMFEEAVKRAEKYYAKDLASGKITRDQLIDNVAKQANAAFGEMNYKYIGRNPTLQDVLRIALLAPDFLEARLKFFSQAARPYGKEQAYALLRGAIIMATTAQVINWIFGDDNTSAWYKRPFSIIIGGREYTPRSVVGDMMHLVTNPRSFWYNRLNPLWGRPIVEIATGRDFYGRKVGPVDAAKDVLKSWVPIPAQGLTKDTMGDTFIDSTINSLLQSVGVSNYMYKSDFERYAMENKRITYRPTDRSRLKVELEQKVSRKDPDAMKDIAEARKEGKITEMEAKDIIKTGVTPSAVRAARSLELDDLAKGLKHATGEEMKLIAPIFLKKLNDKMNEGAIKKEEYQKYIEMLNEAEKPKIKEYD